MAELPDLATIRALVSQVSAAASPAARAIHPAGEAPRRLAALPGAFNPPTLAHVALARAARERGFDAVGFALATRTIDKEDAAGLPLEERLWLLSAIAAEEPGLRVLVQNRGLYAEQALAVRALFPSLEDLWFVVGMDKVGQIFDPRYYADFEASLESLFARAGLLVAARGALDREALRGLLAHDPAKRHAGRIRWLELDPRWRSLSATAVRERLAAGALPGEWLPTAVARFLRDHPSRFRRVR
jgi:nicotinamide-nucleotide adenylyltransferase